MKLSIQKQAREIQKENACAGVYFDNEAGLKACNVNNPTQLLSCKFCEIFNSIYFDHEKKNHKFLGESIYFWVAFESYCFNGHA